MNNNKFNSWLSVNFQFKNQGTVWLRLLNSDFFSSYNLQNKYDKKLL